MKTKTTRVTEGTEKASSRQELFGVDRRTFILTTVLLCALYFTSYITRKSFSAIKLGLPEGLVGDQQIGLIGSALFFFYGAGQIVSGFLGDRIDPRKIIFTGLFSTLVCNALFPLITSVPLLICLWAVNGFAQAMFWPPLVKLLTIYVGDGKAYTKGVMWVSTASQAAIFAVYALATLWIRLNLWWGIFAAASGLAIVIGTALFFGFGKLERDYPGKVAAAMQNASGAKIAAAQKTAEKSTPLMKIVLATGLLSVFVMTATVGFLRDGMEEWISTYFHDVFGIAADASTLMNVVMPLFGIFCVRVTNMLYLKVFRQNDMSQSLFLTGIICVMGVLLGATSGINPLLSLLFAVLMIGSTHAVNTTLTCYLPVKYVPYGCVSTVSGLVNAFTYVGSTVATSLTPFLVERFSWRVTIFCWASVGGLCLLAGMLILRRWTKFLAGQNS